MYKNRLVSVSVAVVGMLSWLPASAEKLFFVEKTGSDECVSKYLEIPSKKETVLMHSKDCPKNLIWDMKNKTLYYTSEDFLFSRPLDRSKMGPQKLVKLPQKENFSISLDAEKHQPLISYLVEVPIEDYKFTGEGETRKEIYKFEGKTYETTTTPPWGIPYVAISAVLEKGKWKRLEVVPTKSEAGDTPGLDALSERKTEGLSMSEIAKDMYCYSKKLDCTAEDKKIAKLVKAEESDNYGHIETKKSEFVFGTLFGDSMHASAPVFLCQNHCATSKKLKEVTETQIGLATQGDYLLVVNEFTGDNPRVYDADGKLVYDNSSASQTIWFTGE